MPGPAFSRLCNALGDHLNILWPMSTEKSVILCDTSG